MTGTRPARGERLRLACLAVVWVAVAWLAGASVTGCAGGFRGSAGSDGAGGGPVVLRVADMTVDRAELERAVHALHGSEATYADLDAAARQAILDALTGARLLALEATARGLDQRPAIVAALDSVEQALLLRTIYERDVYGSLPTPGDSAVAALYWEWGSGAQVRAAHILVRRREQAEAILRRLAAGQDFARLAQTESVHTMSSAQGGDMGYLRHNQVPDAIAAVIWDLPVGQVVPQPVRTSMGWHVVRVLDRRRLSLEDQRPALLEELRLRARARAATAFRDSLRQAYEVHYHGGTATAVATLRDTLAGDRVLFDWRRGQLDLAGFLHRARVPDPVTADTARMRRLGEDLVFETLAARAARARGYGALRAVREPLEEKRLGLLGEALYRDVTTPAPAADTLRAFFDTHRERFRGPPHVTIREILVDDMAQADSLYRRLLAGDDMEALARRTTVRTDLARTGGLWPDVNPHDPRSARIYRAALRAGPGLQPPLAVPGGVSIFDVLQTTAGDLPDFAAAGDAVAAGYAAWQMDELIATLRQRHRSEIWIAADISIPSSADAPLR